MEEGEFAVGFDGRRLDKLGPRLRDDNPQEPGSEYSAVVILLTTQHHVMLQRNLVYTGVTRGKRLIVLVRQRKAPAIAVKWSRAKRRWPKLWEWLGTEFLANLST